jgi:hypothetical protein
MIAEPRPPPLGVKREERSRVVSSSKTTGKVRAQAHPEKPGLYSLIALLAPVSLAWADPVPSNRVIDWTYAGVPRGIPNPLTICAAPGFAARTWVREGSIAIRDQAPLRLFQPQPLSFPVVFDEHDAGRFEG